MIIIASVIVDVPVAQTNRPFDYLVPEVYANNLAVGMRVSVPFGKGDRLLQGYVIGLKKAQTKPHNLKKIEHVIDLEPVLNEELLQLSDWLAKKTFSFRISSLQTILPGVMRGKYHKYAQVTDTEDPKVKSVFKHQRMIEITDQLDAQVISDLMRWRQAGKVKFEYAVENQARVKKQKAIILDHSGQEYEKLSQKLRKRAPKQAAVLAYLAREAKEQKHILLQVLNKKFSSSAIRSLVEKSILTEQNVEVKREVIPTDKAFVHEHDKPLLPDQQKAVIAINQATAAKAKKVFLLEGVTGSGKTEVYLQSIKAVLAKGRTALMLVPEIALTPQMVQRVYARFGHQVAVLHSGLSNGEKYDEWRRINANEARVVVGARSAIFAPLKNIGLIIMDEEHEYSYKQEDTPRYHARDVALHRAQVHNCPVVLGSATPSLESRARAEKGVYQLLLLPQRVNQAPLPHVHIVDMRENIEKHRTLDFSRALSDAITVRLAKKEQSVLMLNRRGFSSFVMCRNCGYVAKCPNCDISLTLHMSSHTLKCHYCGHEEQIPKTCPNCHSQKIRYYGTGTEKVAQELKQMYPEARIIRMDVDTTRRKGAYEQLLKKFEKREADILLGTQMIAKGLDFPNVTLVGVINADTALGLPDFRASERTFQLLTQVSGRAGRGSKKGEVYVQSYNPDHYAIKLAQKQDYEQFFRQEMRLRHEGGYPPYYFTVLLQTTHPDESQAAKAAYSILKAIQPYLSEQAIILGPTPKAIARVKNQYYYQIIIKYKNEPKLAVGLNHILELSAKAHDRLLKIAIDREPLQFI
ncbi:primosomal protein N' [Agrilactobacillus fermenti]|uniref:primosomal protein N' n=1 Tax=Agrilactobacillus fermenti TaxID=2586909 RepID=UPI001E3DF21C|nr:primosomal protein N' [Agrilactobacillus fermenti]MCD2256219.1 primosomal protein N' [Agrilactobacillus fermenti]